MATSAQSHASQHWDSVYSTKSAQERSWTETVPDESLDFIKQTSTDLDAPVIDIGGGASLLVDELLNAGYSNVSLLDISQSALDETKTRIDATPNKSHVSYICTDITQWQPTHTYTTWHDRAVFHFLTDESDRNIYVALASTAIASGGHLVLATFAPDGPESCSGLPVQRWSVNELARLFSDSFTLVDSTTSNHTTPWDSKQPFTWVVLKRK